MKLRRIFRVPIQTRLFFRWRNLVIVLELIHLKMEVSKNAARKLNPLTAGHDYIRFFLVFFNKLSTSYQTC